MRGLDVPTILTVVAVDVVLAVWAMSTTIFLAVIPAPLLVRLFLGLIGLGQILGLLSLGCSLSYSLVNPEWMFGRSDRFWAEMLMVLVVVVTNMGLQFSWSLALLSPPSSNRALPMRLFAASLVIVGFVASYLLCGHLLSYIPLTVWLVATAMLCVTQMLISVNERERLGIRVSRKIPRSRLLRLPAFLLYSGSAGGVVFTTLLLLGSLAAALSVIVIKGDLDASTAAPVAAAFGVPPAMTGVGGWNNLDDMYLLLRFAVVVFLYAYCYCMTAVVVRTVLFRNQVRPTFTWLIVMLLVGLGSVGPYMIAYFVVRHPLAHDDTLSLVTNPFESIGRAMSYEARYNHDPFDVFCMPVLLIWAGVATLCALPWMVKQFIGFSPSHKVERPVLVEPVVA
jgi:hypothetical protein